MYLFIRRCLLCYARFYRIPSVLLPRYRHGWSMLIGDSWWTFFIAILMHARENLEDLEQSEIRTMMLRLPRIDVSRVCQVGNLCEWQHWFSVSFSLFICRHWLRHTISGMKLWKDKCQRTETCSPIFHNSLHHHDILFVILFTLCTILCISSWSSSKFNDYY